MAGSLPTSGETVCLDDLFDLTTQDREKKFLEFSYQISLLKTHFPLTTAYEPRLLKTGERLPFTDFAFDMAVSAYYLFHHCQQDLNAHVLIIQELARVAKEVRIFPLVNLDDKPSKLLGPVLLRLQDMNYGVEVREVRHSAASHQKAMLRVWPQVCTVPAKHSVSSD